MVTAGMCNGTPDWQLDRAYETDTARRLEEAYAEDFELPVNLIDDEFQIAKDYLGKAVDHLHRAGKMTDEFGKSKQIDDLIAKLDDDIPYEIGQIIKKLKEEA